VPVNRIATQGFADAAADYERGRPDYPPEAVSCLFGRLGIGVGTRVLDLAAGTGKLTRALVEADADVVAVEPVDGMRAALERALPAVRALRGEAEAIPLADGSVEAVVVGQAFHWFDGEAALPEIHRVLAPGGALGLIWNARDEAVPWVARLTELMAPHRGEAPGYAAGRWREAFEHTTLFTPLERAAFCHLHELDPEGVVARVASVSFIAALPEAERAGVLARVREGVPAGDAVALPYRTDVYWCDRV
jgi:SAM-dependent methyltransferase